MDLRTLFHYVEIQYLRFTIPFKPQHSITSLEILIRFYGGHDQTILFGILLQSPQPNPHSNLRIFYHNLGIPVKFVITKYSNSDMFL